MNDLTLILRRITRKYHICVQFFQDNVVYVDYQDLKYCKEISPFLTWKAVICVAGNELSKTRVFEILTDIPVDKKGEYTQFVLYRDRGRPKFWDRWTYSLRFYTERQIFIYFYLNSYLDIESYELKKKFEAFLQSGWLDRNIGQINPNEQRAEKGCT